MRRLQHLTRVQGMKVRIVIPQANGGFVKYGRHSILPRTECCEIGQVAETFVELRDGFG
jgi:hypothetical protein